MQVISYIVLYASITLWNFGLIYLMNLRLNQETVEAKKIYSDVQYYPGRSLITRLRDGLFIEVNHGFTKMSGYSREEVLGTHLMWISGLTHRTRPFHRAFN